jgi:outer membrane biosynthesis protein TonB
VRFAYADASPSPDFTQEAIKAVKEWTFEPARLGGQPVAVLIVVTMEFD